MRYIGGIVMIRPQLTGGWSEPRPLTMQDRKIFAEAVGGMVGATYTPHLVSTQVVSGTNYAFLCGMRSATRSAEVGFAVVLAHKPLSGKVQLIDIRNCGIANSMRNGADRAAPENAK